MLKRLATLVIDGASWKRIALLGLVYAGCISLLNAADA
jgi:hypothetical protein